MCTTAETRKKCLRNGCNNIANGHFCSSKCRRNHIASENERLRTLGLPEIGNPKPAKTCECPGCSNTTKTRQNKYCSLKCSTEHRRMKRRKIFCKGCLNEITTTYRRNKVFCRQACKSSYFLKKKKICKNTGCSNYIKKRAKYFCSKKCRFEYSTIEKQKTCLQCDKSLSRNQMRFNGKYCSQSCYEQNRSIVFRDGEVKIMRRKGLLRRYIRINGEFVLFSRYLWEQHNGKIPSSNKIVFKDGDQLNDHNINNLEMVYSGKKTVEFKDMIEDMELVFEQPSSEKIEYYVFDKENEIF